MKNNPSFGERYPVMKKVTELLVYGTRYIIAKDSHGYWGINEKYLDANGCLTTRLNGIQGNLTSTLKDCIDMCKTEAHLVQLLKDGYSFSDAAVKVINL